MECNSRLPLITRDNVSDINGLTSAAQVVSEMDTSPSSRESIESDNEQVNNHRPLQQINSSDQCLDFHTLFEALYPARLKWQNLGLALGLDNITLENIKKKEREDCDECLRSMIQKLDTTSEKLTWDRISQALKTPTVDMAPLAQTVGTLNSPLYISFHSSNITSVCVRKYTNFLKDKYKNMSMFPDEWPPPLVERKFSKLALIEKKKQKFSNAKATQSIEYDYATGNVDNIVTRKLEIELEQIFKPLLDNLESEKLNKFIVLIDGAPGVGKTTLTRKICIDWAKGKLLTDHQIVILKPLREIRGLTTTSLSDILQTDDPELKEQVIKHIQKSSGSGVMFIFDGFDELSSDQQYNTSTLFWKLITGNVFDKCSVLVTSRSYASDPIQEINRVNRHVEVLGFKKHDIERCINQNITDKEKAVNLLQMLRQRLDIVSLCYIPLNCRIVLYVYQQLGTLPDTLTQLYEVFILHTIKHYKNRISVIKNKSDIQKANCIDQLPAILKDYLKILSKLAYTGIAKRKLVFEHSELQTENSSLQVENTMKLGLLNAVGDSGLCNYYQFLHLTIQEFLAARHLASVKNKEELLEFIKKEKNEKQFRLTLVFLFGLTKLTCFPDEKIHHDPNSLTAIQQEISQLILYTQFLYESRQTTHNWLLPLMATNSLDLYLHTSLTQFESLALANFLAMTPENYVWDEIKLQCGNDCLRVLLTKKHQKHDISCLCLTKSITISNNFLFFEETCIIDLLVSLLLKESKVISFSIPPVDFSASCKAIKDCNLSKKLIDYIYISHTMAIDRRGISSPYSDNLSKHISHSPEYCSGVFLKLLEPFPIYYMPKLDLNVPKVFENCSECNTSGHDAWEDVLYRCQRVLENICISKRYFTDRDISLLIKSIKYNRTLLKICLKTESSISYEHLVQLNKCTQATVYVTINDCLSVSINSKNYILIQINNKSKNKVSDSALLSLFSSFLSQPLLSELQGIMVDFIEFMSKEVLALLATSKIVTSITINRTALKSIPIAEEFQEMLENTQTLQTLTLDNCELSDTFIKHLEDGLSHNTAVALAVNLDAFWSHKYSIKSLLHIRSKSLYELDILELDLTKENVSQLSQIVEVCTQLKVLKVKLNDDSKTFFSALSGNQNIKNLIVTTTGKSLCMMLFQTLSSTSITTLEVSSSQMLEDEESIAFKKFLNEIKVLSVLKAKDNQMTSKALNGIVLSHQSSLTELELSFKGISEETTTEFLTSLKCSHITTLTISDLHIRKSNSSESYKAFKQLLTDNKTLTVLSVCSSSNHIGHGVVSCIAEALAQDCSLQELTIEGCSSSKQRWTELFKSLHHNKTLLSLNCSESSIAPGESTKSLCEMLLSNKHLQNLKISDELIKDHYKDFARAYAWRHSVSEFNLTVENLNTLLVIEIEKHSPHFYYFYIGQ